MISNQYGFSDTLFRWLEIPRGSSGFDSQGLDVDIVSIYETPENRHGNGNSHSSNGWVYRGFPVVIVVFVGFFIWFVEIVLLRLFGSKQSSPERTYELTVSSEIALAKVQDDIMCHLRRMQERFEWILNIFWHYFWKIHCSNSAIETLKQCIFKCVSLDEIIAELSQIQFFLQVVPASNQCLRHLMWRPMSFSPAKQSGVLVAWLAVCVSIVSMFFIFRIFHICQRFGVLCFTMIFPKGVHVQLDGWPWNGEGVLGALRCAGTQCWSSSNQGKVECWF